jgi:hypothetical protein
MKLNHGLHLAYCTNIHRGETWAETFDSLKRNTLRVRERVCSEQSYAIGLRLSNQAAVELSDPTALLEFLRWLELNHCYVFTINGFPYGNFHGRRVKEQVYVPDWTTPERLAYTKLLFELLSQLVPGGVEGSVSTVPCGFKKLVTTAEELQVIRDNLWSCVEHIAHVSAKAGRKLHLGLEPEPGCLLETTAEVAQFFDQLRAEHRNDPRLAEHLGVNYDTCHLAVEFEEPQQAIPFLQQHGVKFSKLHLSSALNLRPTREARQALAAFTDDVYLHQVIVRHANGRRAAYLDLDDALASEPPMDNEAAGASIPHSPLRSPPSGSSTPPSVLRPPHSDEWRVHFHIPLHSPPTSLFGNTTGHLLGVLDLLQANPGLCSHLEMETYTWEVLPQEYKSWDVVEQLAAEYEWTLGRLAERGLCDKPNIAK